MEYADDVHRNRAKKNVKKRFICENDRMMKMTVKVK